MKELLSWAIAIIVVVILSVGLYETRDVLKATRVQLAEQVAITEALRASQVQMRTDLTAIQKKSQAVRVEVKDALDQDPAYRDTPVPLSVATGLCKRVKCSK
jgi:hypothetical protein